MPDNNTFISDPSVIDSPIKPVEKPEKEIGIDTKNHLFQNIINAESSSKIDVAQLESFTSISRSREQVYQILDTMSDDSMISAVLETYAEDATEYNDEGKIVWVESSNPNISSYIGFLLKTLGIDKHIYSWAYSLCKYGDLYIRLFRKSDYNDLFFDNKKIQLNESSKISNEDKQLLNEDVKIKAYSKNDNYVHYVEMVSNPAEMFELTRLGKTAGYIEAQINTTNQINLNGLQPNGIYRYRFNRNDVNLYAATEFVHACLEDNTSRVPEYVDIFLNNDTDNTTAQSMSYSVRRGQSLLYNSYKIWRELELLENSILLNRVTKSSIVRIIGVEVGDMPKEMVGPHLQGIKQMIEQKASLNDGISMTEYNNPGPIINNIYVPTHEGVGAITPQSIGGDDANVRDLADLDYYMNKFFGGLRVPKQYFSQTDDSTGFNGGTSLSIISSRYAKMIKRIQNTLIQAITDMLNLMLIDAGLDNYINHFVIHMLPPTTQEEKDRRENIASRVSLTNDIMNMLGDIDNIPLKLKILKSLLSNAITDDEVIQLLQTEITKLESEAVADEKITVTTEDSEDASNSDVSFDSTSSENYDESQPINVDDSTSEFDISAISSDTTAESPSTEITIEPDETQSLPSPTDLGQDFTSM